MNPLQMNLNGKVNQNQFTRNKANDLIKRNEKNTFDRILSQNMKQQKEHVFEKRSDKKFVENTNSKEKSNIKHQPVQKEKTEKNPTISDKEVEEIETIKKEELPQELMDVIASLNKLLEEMDQKMLGEGKDATLTTSFEKLKVQLNELLSNIEQNDQVAMQDTTSLKETVMQLMNELEIVMENNEVKVESENFNKILSQIKALLEEDEYDKIKDMPISNEGTDKKDLTNVQREENTKIDAKTVKNETTPNEKKEATLNPRNETTPKASNETTPKASNETKSDSENQKQMSQNQGSKKGFFANKEQNVMMNDKIIQELQTNYNVQSNMTSSENIKIENAMLQKPNFNNILEQMIEKAQVTVDEKGSEMSLQLKPDHLGNLSMKIAVERGIVVANIVAENQAVKEVIESNFNTLRDALNEKGFGISELNVSVGQDSDFNQQQSFMNFNKKNGGKMTMNNGLDYEATLTHEEENTVRSMNETQIDYLG